MKQRTGIIASLCVALLASTAPSLCARAGNADESSTLLQRVQSNVEKFVDDFGLMRYQENVEQQKLRDNEKVAYQQEFVFDSIMRMRYDEGKLKADEQRIMERTPRHVEARPLVSTYGFSTLAMVFHPYYADDFRFSQLAMDSSQDAGLTRIHFEHIAGKPTPVLYQMIGADKPLELSGDAWVDAASGDIHRIQMTLKITVDDPGIKAIRAELSYSPVTLEDETAPRFLPATATIDVETARQHWRNIHKFQDYRKYRVSINMSGATTQ